jgi:hypothetical protein
MLHVEGGGGCGGGLGWVLNVKRKKLVDLLGKKGRTKIL